MFRNSLVGDCVALSKGFNLVRRNSAISLSSSFSLVEKRKINLLQKICFLCSRDSKSESSWDPVTGKQFTLFFLKTLNFAAYLRANYFQK